MDALTTADDLPDHRESAPSKIVRYRPRPGAGLVTTTTGHLDRVVARAAVARAVLLGRAAATLAVAGGGLRLRAQPASLIVVLVLVFATAAVALVALSRHPHVVAHPLPVLAADAAIVLVVLGVGDGDVAFFCCAAGASALAGVLVGFRALLPAAGYAGLGYLVAARLLGRRRPRRAWPASCSPSRSSTCSPRSAPPWRPPRWPPTSSCRSQLVASAQRTAAAAERARLARELHDSVTKTLRGVSFAALALPTSLRRQPALAEQLAATVSAGAAAAVRQAQERPRGPAPRRPWTTSSARRWTGICRRWTEREGIPVRTSIATADLPLDLRYELAQILHESLENIARHAGASRVTVELAAHRRPASGCASPTTGPGFAYRPSCSGCFGLIGMAERAAADPRHPAGGLRAGRGNDRRNRRRDRPLTAAASAGTPS